MNILGTNNHQEFNVSKQAGLNCADGEIFDDFKEDLNNSSSDEGKDKRVSSSSRVNFSKLTNKE